ncbi:hypothetical protein C8Q80DRAFT_1171499 [Daedaleopsis nitida]|nr:hypothetical protein C8Q80DRAFT_1171499 [Daedaleopsis nitida]
MAWRLSDYIVTNEPYCAVTGRYHPAYSWYDACIFRRVGADASDLASVGALGYIHRDPEDVAEILRAAGWCLVRNGKEGCVWRVQSNRIAHGQFETHEVAWRPEQPAGDEMRVVKECGAWAGDGFVRMLQPGDRVGLWMRAMYPGWANYVKETSVEILYEAH